METLQKKINARAEEKLKAEIKENFLQEKFLQEINYGEFVGLVEAKEPFNKWSMQSILYPGNSSGKILRDFVFDKLIKKYIAAETELFLKEHEDLKIRLLELSYEIENH